MHIDGPIRITTADDVITAGVCTWRQCQTSYATVAVKATFTLTADAPMTLRAPVPIERTERALPNSDGIEPGDLAPCLVQPEIWLRGHAWFPLTDADTFARVRLVIARDAKLLLSKLVRIPRQTETSAPPSLSAFAPLSRLSPARASLLGHIDPSALARFPDELPEAFDWTYFHAAPPDQRIVPLRGDEWVRLQGVHRTIQRFDTRLPSASCTVKMFGPTDSMRHGVALRVGLDTIQLDADRGSCSLVFRGHTQLADDIALEDIQFVAGLGLPDRPMPALQAPKNSASSAHASATKAPCYEDTFAIDESLLQALEAGKPIPMGLGLPRPPVAQPQSRKFSASETFAIDDSVLEALATAKALPFDPRSSGPQAAPPPPIAAQSQTPKFSAGETFAIDDSILEKLAAARDLPFDPRSSGPQAAPPLQKAAQSQSRKFSPGETFAIDDSILEALATAKALPFDPSLPTSQPTASSPPVVASSSNHASQPPRDTGMTFILSDDILAQLGLQHAIPFAEPEPQQHRFEHVDALAEIPFLTATNKDEGSAPTSLGEYFLAAMAALSE